MLIATLPPIYRERLLDEIISCPAVDAVRYNTGMISPNSPEETLSIIKSKADRHAKKIWIDLKGRQLRITNWALPDFGKITINHEIEVDGPAYVCFRDGEKLDLKFASGNVIYVDPPPRHAVGEGQSLNIIGECVKIRGYLTETDRTFIQAARILGMTNFMLSFVEGWSDIEEVTSEFKKASGTESQLDLVLKIESSKGLSFAATLKDDTFATMHIMAARDDLFIALGENNFSILHALKMLALKDEHAIVASRLFSGLEQNGKIALSDLSDIALMKQFGYQHFMLSDEICHHHFKTAIDAWQKIV